MRIINSWAAIALAMMLTTESTLAVTYTANNTLDINPSSLGATGSEADAIIGNESLGTAWGSVFGNGQHAFLWSGGMNTGVDLTPNGYIQTFGAAISGASVGPSEPTQQVGYGIGPVTSSMYHALLWTGTAASAVDLHPINLTGFLQSEALATNGSQQAGYGELQSNDYDHAILWSGSASTAVDLNPTQAGISWSIAYGISYVHEVGRGQASSGVHALLWSGSAWSVVDLNPAGFTTSAALGVHDNSYMPTDGNQEVGWGDTPGYAEHALLWSGTAASAVDLNPVNLPGIQESRAVATNGSQQVGYGYLYSSSDQQMTHAIVWSGSAASAVDLNQLTPGGAAFSAATGIDAYGNISGYATLGNPYDPTAVHAVEWFAGDTYKISTGTGTWNSPSNWIAGVPKTGDDVLVTSSDGSYHTIVFSNPDSSVMLGNFTLDAINYGAITLSQSQDTLNVANEWIGYASGGGGGIYEINGGANIVRGTLAIGTMFGSSGNCTVDGSGQLNAKIVTVGSGSLNIFGGNATIGTVNLIQYASLQYFGGTFSFTTFNQNGGQVSASISGPSELTVAPGATYSYMAGTFSGILSNNGTVEVRSGTFQPSKGAAQLSGSSLTGGAWIIRNGGKLALTNGGNITTLAPAASVLLDGVDSVFSQIDSLVDNQGHFTITNGRNFLSTEPFVNSGMLKIGPSSTFEATGTLANSGTVDIAGGTMDLDQGLSSGTVRGQILSGFDGGAWDGLGIISSLAIDHPGTAVGYAGNGVGYTLAYTWIGDADLNGIVNAADFSVMAASGTKNATWSMGDFNYDGVVDGDDYALLLLGTTLGGQNISTILPEPSLLLASGFCLLAFRRSCRRGER